MFIGVSIKSFLIILFFTGRKEDETDDKWMEKEKERAAKERERLEKGKKTQMWILFSYITSLCTIMLNYIRRHTAWPVT